MIKFQNYFKIISLLLIVLVIIAAVILSRFGNDEDRIGAGIGFLISYLNALAGFAIISRGYRQSLNKFMAYFYGGMILRFLLIFGTLFILIVGFEIPIVALLLSLCVSYFIFLGLEIYIIYKNAELNS